MLVNSEPVFVAMLGILSRFVWRHRSALAPVSLAGIAFLASAVAHVRYPHAWVSLIVATVVIGVALGIPHTVLKRSPAGVRVATVLARTWSACGMDRPTERAYGAVVVVVVGGWSALAISMGPYTRPLPAVWLAGIAVCGIPWWLHRRRRARVRVERITADWPTLAESMGLPGSRIASAVADAWGFSARLRLRKGSTVTDAVGRIPSIESALGMRAGSVRILPDARRADRCVMRVVERDPHAEPLAWPAPAAASINRPIILGLFEDAREVAVSFLRRHVLVGGVVGSGKSGIVNVILGALAACRDAVVWGIDLKEGMELSPWKPCLGRLATTGKQATELLRNGVAELERRARILTTQGRRVWEPAPGHPALVIVIDEYAELPEEAREYADSIARRGRAVAVTLIVATQRPTQKTMGGATRTQMDIRICLRVRERRDADLILGQGFSKQGWNADALTLPGSFLISGPEHPNADRARAWEVTDDAVIRHVTDHGARRPRLPAPAVAPSEALSTPQRPGEGAAGTSATRAPVAPEAALWAALRRAGAGGASVDGLMSASGMGRSWVYYRLREHADAGRAVQLARGRWRAADDQGRESGPGPAGPTRTRRARRARRRLRPPNRDTQ
ncbi:FtsK/SpoIIIE domain-containing protein [Streptomyces sp. NBC_01803]|uniref:FtsK/SpoIIIE domain-containing protein n=1 Tax=Streptomyces sp. NBC_01803 TaxID=2975946 RepID=UPI002DD937C5|nr:FtsK/SpoIIIE domain-containing protein [Streptomyces sp. NBC_01803]WSA45743.1 FtsK/SpoIIIE domain-containing protein [Streptomyces sp. NBC_01803]